MIAAAPTNLRFLLLLKSTKFAHQAGYYLLNGRWHAVKTDKPAPKGAPVAHHPHAAGAPVSGHATLTDAEWDQLKLPPENVNAGTFNKQLDQLKAAANAGDVTGIVASGYGVNTYGKKLAVIANHVLELMGSSHKVSPGQKPGAHPAVQTPAQIEAGQPAPDVTLTNEGDTPAEQGQIEAENNGAEPVATEPAEQNQEPAQDVGSGLTMPEFAEGKTTTGVKAYYEKLAQKIIDHAQAGNVSVLEDMKAYGLKPNAKGHVTNTWKGKTPNSKKLLALHDHAIAYAKGDQNPIKNETQAAGAQAAAEPAPIKKEPRLVLPKKAAPAAPASQSTSKLAEIPWDEQLLPDANSNAKSHNGQVAKIKAMAEAGDVAGLQAYVDAKAGAKQTYAKKQHLLAQTALAALKESDASYTAPTKEQADAELAQMVSGTKLPGEVLAEDATAAGFKAIVHGKHGVVLASKGSDYPKTYANLTQAESAVGKLAAAGFDAHATGKHPYLVVITGKTAAQAPAASGVPVKPTFGGSSTWDDIASEIESAMNVGDIDALQKHITSSDGLPSEAAKKINQYAKDALDYVGGVAPEAGTKAAAVGTVVTGEGFKFEKTDSGWVKIDKDFVQYQPFAPHKNMSAAIELAAGAPVPKEWLDYQKTKDPQKAEIAADIVADLAIDYGGKPEHVLGQVFPVGQQNGPKEGDTKTLNGVTYVLKNGRWHKQGDEHAAAPAQPAQAAPAAPAKKLTKEEKEAAIKAAVDAVQIPDFTGADGGSNAVYYGPMAEKIKAAALAEGLAGFKKLVTTGADGSFASKNAALGFKTNKCFESSKEPRRKLFWKFCNELKAALESQKGPTKASKPAAAPTAAVPPLGSSSGSIESMDSWQQTGPQGGSNPGGRFKDHEGVEWYCKFPGDDDVAKSEVLASKLYAALGVAGQDAKLITKDGKIGIASRWVNVKKASSPAELAKVDGVRSGFGADAWLGNWDVVGLGYDNLQVGDDGKAMRVDAGGSLTYRAQGGKKAFGTSVTEIDSLRDPKINPQAANVFGGMTDADITASVAKVLALPDASIKNLVELYGPGDAANKKALADVLIARKADLAAKFPKAVKPAKKRLDPNHLPVKEDRLPKPHDFNNWLGSGKPLSSQPHVNAANQAVEQEMLELAKTGNLVKLKEFKYHAIDKATGTATGQLLPIANHPSKHVVQLHADLVQMLDEIANPPQPLKVFQETDVGTIEQLSAALPPKKFGTTVNAVHSNEKLGFWVVLGTAHGATKFAPKKVMDYTKEAIAAAYDKFKQGSALAKHFIQSVQASGSYNDLFRNGKTVDHSGNKLADVAQAALEHATTMPEGTSLYRWQNMPDDMVKKIMSAPDGTVFQATGPMCTSYHPTATSGFGQHRVVIRYAKGAKAVESFGSGGFSSEKEVTTLPNSRFVVLSKQMVPNEKYPGKQRLELEVLMLPPDLGL